MKRITHKKIRGLSRSFFNRDRISVKSLSMGDALEDQFAALDQCSSVTCKPIDTIHGVAARYVSENSDDRLTTSSQLADESWAPVAQGHLGPEFGRSVHLTLLRTLGSASPCSQSYLIDPPRVGLGQRWVRYSAPFLARSKFDLKHERKGRGKASRF
jgi:hypothetical protein